MTLGDIGRPSTTDFFAEKGYAHVPSIGLAPEDFASARVLLDGLFDRFSSLPRRFAHDLGASPESAGPPVLPEILEVSTLAPALRRTPVFRAAYALARQMLGEQAFLVYDHAIYKPPGTSGTTSWHQDSGYDPKASDGLAIWIPFQDTGVIDGAMRYVPGSHLGGPLPHLSRTNPDGKVVKYLEVADSDAVDVPCELGGATMHGLHTIHGAGPNLGGNVRRAWILDFEAMSPLRRAYRTSKRAVTSWTHAGR